MDGDQIYESTQVFGLPPVPPLNIGIAIDDKKSSVSVLNWALQKFCSEDQVVFKLLHVFPKITRIPTPLGSRIPISQAREDIVSAFKNEVTWNKRKLLLPYKKICTNKNVQADIILIESDDIPNAMAEEVTNNNIKRLVVGASPSSLTKRNKDNKLSSKLSNAVPKFCSVYGISKGKVLFIQKSDSESFGSNRYERSLSSSSTSVQQNQNSTPVSDNSSVSSLNLSGLPSLTIQRLQALAAINQAFHGRTSSIDSRGNSSETEEMVSSISSSKSSRFERDLSPNSTPNSLLLDDKLENITSHYSYSMEPLSSINQESINMELDKLRIQLRHAQGMYAIAQNEAIDSSKKVDDLNKKKIEEVEKLKESYTKEEEAKELVKDTKERHEIAVQEADYLKLMAGRESLQKQEAETKIEQELREKEKLQNALTGTFQQYRSFSWNEIVSATNSFSEELKIGMGGYGTVYKCSLHHTTAAVKVLHSIEGSDAKQFHKEIEILSRIRHPNLLILLGACEEPKCIVYEYMENGSLEDRLLRLSNTPPIPWKERFRIALEVASALLFLHSSKPKPVIHRDLKPANILLDQNFVSKIGDVGLSTMVEPSVSSMANETGPVGTLCYIDPEYQRTGIVSPKSDIYALGIVILQLLTAKPAIGLTHKVETAVSANSFQDMLDKEAGKWPMEEAMELAKLGLSCAELRRQDRPDLGRKVLPELQRLNKLFDDGTCLKKNLSPLHFICPISTDLMTDPCVAADGYTYNRNEIHKWLQENGTSPMTNLPLTNKDLIPNYTLLSAILDWNPTRN